MFDPHVGHDFKPCPHWTHTAKWPQGTNANARCLVEHTIHRLVAAFVDARCDEELGDGWDNDFCWSVSECLFSDNPLLDVLDDSILTQL
jgi:hypothetical protein